MRLAPFSIPLERADTLITFKRLIIANKRKRTTALSNTDLKSLFAADVAATRLGLPLNVLITFHPRGSHMMSLQERLLEFRRMVNCYCQFGRQHGFKRAWLYTREIALDTRAEHFHLLCHAPTRLRTRFISNAVGWGREPGACHAEAATTQSYWSRQGYRFSSLLYIAKQMSPQAAYNRPYRRIGPAEVIGARWGASRNIKKG